MVKHGGLRNRNNWSKLSGRPETLCFFLDPLFRQRCEEIHVRNKNKTINQKYEKYIRVLVVYTLATNAIIVNSGKYNSFAGSRELVASQHHALIDKSGLWRYRDRIAYLTRTWQRSRHQWSLQTSLLFNLINRLEYSYI